MPSKSEPKNFPGKIETVTLPVEGMTCASCVARVERALKKVEGVTSAAVNLATEKATVGFDPSRVTLDKLQAAVSDSGYTLKAPAAEPRPDQAASADKREAPAGPAVRLRRDLLLSAVLTFPVMVLSMLSMADWFQSNFFLTVEQTNKLLFILTTPVLFVT